MTTQKFYEVTKGSKTFFYLNKKFAEVFAKANKLSTDIVTVEEEKTVVEQMIKDDVFKDAAQYKRQQEILNESLVVEVSKKNTKEVKKPTDKTKKHPKKEIKKLNAKNENQPKKDDARLNEIEKTLNNLAEKLSISEATNANLQKQLKTEKQKPKVDLKTAYDLLNEQKKLKNDKMIFDNSTEKINKAISFFDRSDLVLDTQTYRLSLIRFDEFDTEIETIFQISNTFVNTETLKMLKTKINTRVETIDTRLNEIESL
jgi:hypothetical protein